MSSIDHAQTLLRLVAAGAFCEPCPLPWSCERRDEFCGPGTAHEWQLFDADDKTLEYLPADIDGPAFVAWVNAYGVAMKALDGVYSGTSRRIRRLVRLAYLRGVRRGAAVAWEAQQPIGLRDVKSPDRWEIGFRNIVTFVLGPRTPFDIDEVVERVRKLAGCDACGDPIPGAGGPRDMATVRALLTDWLDYAEDDDPNRPLLAATREWLERASATPVVVQATNDSE